MQNANQNNARLEIIGASEIEPREIEWLWYPFIPYGKVTPVQGDLGDGKSTFMLTIAALLTRGELLLFTEMDEPPAPVNVIYQTTEDDADDILTLVFLINFQSHDNKHLLGYFTFFLFAVFSIIGILYLFNILP